MSPTPQFWLTAPPGEAGSAWAADPRPVRHWLEQLAANVTDTGTDRVCHLLARLFPFGLF